MLPALPAPLTGTAYQIVPAVIRHFATHILSFIVYQVGVLNLPRVLRIHFTVCSRKRTSDNSRQGVEQSEFLSCGKPVRGSWARINAFGALWEV